MAIQQVLIERVKQAENIEILTHHIAIDLIVSNKHGQKQQCQGAYVLDVRKGEASTVYATAVVLATGGASRAYLYTTNPDVASGDGIAMAWRAGCRVGNMEFNQFHPTCLYHPEARSFLLTEAIRGEGGILLRKDGTRFMPYHDKRAELAPRDIVARAIDYEMKQSGDDYVYLDISHKPATFIKERFPNIFKRCLSYGVDITKEPAPVVPAAHYTCGGVITDLHGQTDVPGLYAIGETAHTGFHGANRMASNSLLECFVFGKAAAKHIKEALPTLPSPTPVPPWDASRVCPSKEAVVVSHDWEELRRTMWDLVGIVRTTKRLQRAQERLKLLREEIHEYYSHYLITRDLLELRNLLEVSDLIIRCALARKESRGLHTSLDYPEALETFPQDTILAPSPNAQ